MSCFNVRSHTSCMSPVVSALPTTLHVVSIDCGMYDRYSRMTENVLKLYVSLQSRVCAAEN
jgi:hypothetical protein